MKAGSMDLSGKIALVTGGGRGIGATISIVLAQAGADVVINYNTSEDDASKIRDKIKAMGRRAVAIRIDAGDTTQYTALVRQAKEAFGRVDILVSNAGIGQPHKIVDTPDEEWERVMNVNARQEFGRFVTISSNIAVYGRGGGSFATYGASKAALIALTKGIAHEGAPYVTANTILPGPTNRQLPEEKTEPIQIQENERSD